MSGEGTPTQSTNFIANMEAMSSQALDEARLPIEHRQALDSLRSMPIPGPTGKPPKELEDLSVEELKARLKAQTTDSQDYWDQHGLSPEGHLPRTDRG